MCSLNHTLLFKFHKQISCKNWVSDRVFYVAIAVADVDIGSLKSLQTLFDTNLDHMLVQFERKRIVWTIPNFVFLT